MERGGSSPCTSSSPAWRPVSSLLVAAPARWRRERHVRVEGTRGHAAAADRDVDDARARSRKDGSPSHQCARNSAGGALEAATGGNWAGRWASFGDYEIQTIRGETHTSDGRRPSGTYWSFWLNYKFASAGGCGDPMQEGDEVLFFPSCFGVRDGSRRRCGSPGSRPRAAQGQAVRRARGPVRRAPFDSEFNATTTARRPRARR